MTVKDMIHRLQKMPPDMTVTFEYSDTRLQEICIIDRVFTHRVQDPASLGSMVVKTPIEKEASGQVVRLL